MRELRITTDINPALLLEQLDERHPSLRVDGAWQAALSIHEDGTYTLEVPEESDVDEAALQALLAAHDPAAPSAAERALAVRETQLQAVRERAAEDPAFAALAGLLGLDT